jgi:hypothetical protein
VVYLQELDRRAVVLDERDKDPGTRTVRLDDHVLAANRLSDIFDLECDMGNRLDQRRIRRVVLVACPLDAVRTLPYPLTNMRRCARWTSSLSFWVVGIPRW